MGKVISNRSLSPLRTNEAIVAPVTAPGYASIAGIRLSGEGVLKVVERLTGKLLKEREAVLLTFEGIDDVIAIPYHGPRSYTGEDMVEIFCHGNPLVVKLLTGKLMEENIRMAEPGEFSFRAVVNGKMDTLQAEAVNLVVHAPEEISLLQAQRSLSGRLSEKVTRLRRTLTELLTAVQAVIEFPEDGLDLDRDDIRKDLKELVGDTTELLKSSRTAGERAGVEVTIAGPVNVGKSTLFNALLGWERAIVSDEEGTTRDHISETLHLRGIPVTLQDTAGLRETENHIEKEGVERARELLSATRVLLFVVDPDNFNSKTLKEWESLQVPHALFVWNKHDLEPEPAGLPDPHVSISALTQEGISEIFSYLDHQLEEITREWSSFTYLLNHRQQRALELFLKELESACDLLECGAGEEELEYHLRRGTDGLAVLMGEISPDEVIHEIFSSFCIGK